MRDSMIETAVDMMISLLVVTFALGVIFGISVSDLLLQQEGH